MKLFKSKLLWLLKGEAGVAAILQTIFSRTFILAVNLITGIITARVLGPEGRGIQAAIGFWPGVLASTFTLGLPISIVYNFRKYPEKKSELFASTLVLCSILGLLASITGYLFLPHVLNKYSNETIAFAQYIVFTTIAILFCLVLYGAYEGIQKFTISNQARSSIAILTLVFLLALTFSNSLTPYTSSIARLTIYVPVAIWLLFGLWKTLKPKFKDLIPSSKLLVNYGLRSYGINLFGAVSSQVNQALVVSALSPTEMGLFAIGVSFSNMLHVFRTSISTVLLPKAAARPKEEVISLTARAARLCAALTLASGLIAIVLAPQLVTLLYGSEFLEAVVLFRLSVLEVLLIGVTLVLSQAFLSLNKPGTITILQAVGLAAGIPLRMVLIPNYGIVGAGIAILLSTAVRFVFILACFPIILKTRPPNLFINKSDLSYLKKAVFKAT